MFSIRRSTAIVTVIAIQAGGASNITTASDPFNTVGNMEATYIANGPTRPTDPAVLSDPNGDGIVDGFDLLILLGNWG